MRQFLKYTPNHGALTVTPAFNVEDIVGSFTLTVWDKDGKEVLTQPGEVAADLAAITIPGTSSNEDMFMVEMNATIIALESPEDGKQYQMTLLTKQSGQAIADAAKVEGPLPDTKQVITIILVLTPTPSTIG